MEYSSSTTKFGVPYDKQPRRFLYGRANREIVAHSADDFVFSFKSYLLVLLLPHQITINYTNLTQTITLTLLKYINVALFKQIVQHF